MLSWVFQQIVISLVVIVLIHSIYLFLQVNLTTPKVRDLVNNPSKKYEEIYKTFKESENKVEEKQDNNEKLMKSELQNYLKELSSENKQQKTIQEDKTTSVMNELQPASFSDNFTPAYETF
jgi:predicted Holliday junction resolvase-like endonuclease